MCDVCRSGACVDCVFVCEVRKCLVCVGMCVVCV